MRFIDPTGLYLTEEGEGGNCVHDYCNHPYTPTGGPSWADVAGAAADSIGHLCVSAGFCVGGATYLIDGVRFWDGEPGRKQAWKKYKEMGQPEYQSTNKLHRLKSEQGIGANENLAFDEHGNVYRRIFQGGKEFLDDLGNILDDTYGSGFK